MYVCGYKDACFCQDEALQPIQVTGRRYHDILELNHVLVPGKFLDRENDALYYVLD